jgi:hypothetical protein
MFSNWTFSGCGFPHAEQVFCGPGFMLLQLGQRHPSFTTPIVFLGMVTPLY